MRPGLRQGDGAEEVALGWILALPGGQAGWPWLPTCPAGAAASGAALTYAGEVLAPGEGAQGPRPRRVGPPPGNRSAPPPLVVDPN